MITTLSLAFLFSRTASGRLEPIGDFAASADAKKVVFASGSTKFVVAQLKYRDLESGESFEVSTGVDGKAADRSCDNVAISPSGDAVAFTSTATNLISNGTKQDRVYVWDRATKKLRVVSDGVAGEVVNARKHYMSVSDGGRTVMFITGALNGIPAMTWVAEAGKKVATLSSRLGLEPPKKDDLRASICADGKSF